MLSQRDQAIPADRRDTGLSGRWRNLSDSAIDIGKQTHWALDDLHRDAIIEKHGKGRAKPSITRFKGLGEMSPAQLKETTLSPLTRTALRVAVPEGEELITDQVIAELMGTAPAPRSRLISECAHEVDDLDA